jgi:hypothetical protein
MRFLVAFALVLAACAHHEPPQWDAGGAGYSVVALPSSMMPAIDGGGASANDVDGNGGAALAFGAALADAGSGGDGAASEAASVSSASRPAPRDVDQDAGALPQTHDEPQPAGPAFDAHVAALWDAIASDDAERAMPFFFPLAAYEQVKAIASPARDWRIRLAAAYKRDIHDLHIKLGPKASRAKLVRVDVPMARARWVEPGEEYNRIGYYRVFGTKLRGDIDGRAVTVDVTSLISWRGEWYCVHLSGVK